MSEPTLSGHRLLHVRQRHELGELFGFETRNKYEILDGQGQALAFAAEQQKGFWGFLARQFLGHWRRFDIHFFSAARVAWMIARFPFRWFFQRLELFDHTGQLIGAIQQRFSLLSKRFDVLDAFGQVRMEVASPIWRLWTFPFRWKRMGPSQTSDTGGRPVGFVRKKWSGLLAEGWTDKDNFVVEYDDETATDGDRKLILAAAVFIDLQYFERKAGRS